MASSVRSLTRWSDGAGTEPVEKFGALLPQDGAALGKGVAGGYELPIGAMHEAQRVGEALEVANALSLFGLLLRQRDFAEPSAQLGAKVAGQRLTLDQDQAATKDRKSVV